MQPSEFLVAPDQGRFARRTEAAEGTRSGRKGLSLDTPLPPGTLIPSRENPAQFLAGVEPFVGRDAEAGLDDVVQERI